MEWVSVFLLRAVGQAVDWCPLFGHCGLFGSFCPWFLHSSPLCCLLFNPINQQSRFQLLLFALGG